MLDNFYLGKIEKNKNNHLDIYNNVLQDLYGKILSWDEVTNLSNGEQIQLMIELRNRIQIKESDYDVDKLAYAIQNSRSGMGLSVLTDFECLFCGKLETWGNSNVPQICKECSRKMAESIILSGFDLNKD